MEDKTPDLWRAFMPQRNKIASRTGTDLISMRVFPEGPAQIVDPTSMFVKWAAVEVLGQPDLPEGMSTCKQEGGLYAVFDHHGLATDISTFIYIFQTWLPQSEYELDDREHFEVLGEDYQALDPDAEEEILIPVRPVT
jgi:AraC family transcriptional regulator